MGEALLTVAEVARRLNCHPHTVRRWIWDKKLPAVKVGDMVRVSAGEVERFLRPVGKPGAGALIAAMSEMRSAPEDVDALERILNDARAPGENLNPFA